MTRPVFFVMENNINLWPLGLAACMASLNLGLQIGKYAERHDADADGRVMIAQVYNQQLRDQLEVGHKVVAHLRVDDDKQNFRFDTVNPTTQLKEQCSGSYRLLQDRATTTGKLTCVTMVPLR